MSVAEDFVTYLNTQTTVTDRVGVLIGQAPAHIKWNPPYVCFRRRGRVSAPVLAGGDGDMVETQLDVECRAKTLDDAEDLADVLNTLLNGSRGTWGSRKICGVFVQDQDDDYEFLPAGSNSSEKTATLYVQVFSR